MYVCMCVCMSSGNRCVIGYYFWRSPFTGLHVLPSYVTLCVVIIPTIFCALSVSLPTLFPVPCSLLYPRQLNTEVIVPLLPLHLTVSGVGQPFFWERRSALLDKAKGEGVTSEVTAGDMRHYARSMSWSASDFERNLICLLAGILRLWNASFHVLIIHSVWPFMCHLIVCGWLALCRADGWPSVCHLIVCRWSSLCVPLNSMQVIGFICAF